MKKNLVIAAAVGLKVDQLTLFIKSLRKYYKDDVCFIIGQNDHVVEKEIVFSNLNKLKNSNYIGWIGHATFLIKLGDTTIITDPVFSKNAGPLIFGPKRFTEPALTLREIPNYYY